MSNGEIKERKSNGEIKKKKNENLKKGMGVEQTGGMGWIRRKKKEKREREKERGNE